MGSNIHLSTLAACAAFAGKEQARPQLSGVHVIITKSSVTYVATNGHILASRTIANPEGQDNDTVGEWTIPTEECKPFKLAKRETNAIGTLTGNDREVTLSYNGSSRTFTPIELAFPNWRMIVPATVSGALNGHHNFKGEYIDTIQAFAEKLDLGYTVPHWNDDAATVFTFSHAGDSAFCLIMPMRRESRVTEWALPSWVRTTSNEAKAA